MNIRFEHRWAMHPDRRLDSSAPLVLGKNERLVNISHEPNGVTVLAIATDLDQPEEEKSRSLP